VRIRPLADLCQTGACPNSPFSNRSLELPIFLSGTMADHDDIEERIFRLRPKNSLHCQHLLRCKRSENSKYLTHCWKQSKTLKLTP
jgi:hypothetical protein